MLGLLGQAQALEGRVSPSGFPQPSSPSLGNNLSWLPARDSVPLFPEEQEQVRPCHGWGGLLRPLSRLWGSPASQLKVPLALAGRQWEREAQLGAPPCRPAWSSKGEEGSKGRPGAQQGQGWE